MSALALGDITKFFLKSDEKTYWTLLIKEDTTAAGSFKQVPQNFVCSLRRRSDVCQQIADKLQLKHNTITLGTAVPDITGEEMRTFVKLLVTFFKICRLL